MFQGGLRVALLRVLRAAFFVISKECCIIARVNIIVVKDAGITLNRFRYDSAFQHGLEAGGRFLVEGAVVVGRNGRAVSAPAPCGDDVDSSFEQEEALQAWAMSAGCWYPHPESHYKELGFKFYGFGGEAQIYAESDRYVHKICRTGQYANLVLFFDRIAIHNAICPAAFLEVEGYGRDSFGNFVVLLKQVFFRQSHTMSETEITLFMKCMGFQEIVEEPYHKIRYLSDSVVAEDLHSGNIWMTQGDNVVIVDGYFAFRAD